MMPNKTKMMKRKNWKTEK